MMIITAVLLMATFGVLSTMASVDPFVVNFLRDNRSPTGLPLSFWVPPGFWRGVHHDLNNDTLAIERILATYGLNLYDGACWQIALAIANPAYFNSHINPHTRMLLSGKSGDMGIRATNFSDFTFGTGTPYKGKYPFYFRMISDSFWNKDPLTGAKLPWMDWKPVTGENAWLAFLGPLMAYNLYVEKTGEPLNYYQDEIQLAVKMLDVFLAMQSPLGAVYYAPKGTYKVTIPTEIACENNISLYAGLQVLRALLLRLGDPERRIPDIDRILVGIERFFRDEAFNAAQGVFYQGGYIDQSGKFVPNPVFPLDVQTWGLSVIGQQVDSWFGETTSYKIWQQSKRRSGTFDSYGNILGVGYTDGNEVVSVEWTLGAVNMARILAKQYEGSHPDLAEDLLKDARTMRLHMDTLRYEIDSSHAGYMYADIRYAIPFGWFSNPIPSAASTAWIVMMDADVNPFHISGRYIQPPPISTLTVSMKEEPSA